MSSFVGSILVAYVMVVFLAIVFVAVSYASLFAVLVIVPRNWRLHAITSRYIERVPEMAAAVIRSGANILFYGTIILFALLAIYYA